MKNHLIKKFATLIAVCLIAGCALTPSYRTGFYYDDKNPIESYVGLANLQITDTGLLRFSKVSYKLMDEFHATYSDGILSSLGAKTGKRKWVRNPSVERFEIELKWSENPELNQVISISDGSINVEEMLSKAKKNSQLFITCLNCTQVGMPTIIEGGTKLYRDYTFTKTAGEYREEFAERKRQVEISNREYIKRQEIQRKQNEENLKTSKLNEARRAQKVALEGDGSSDDLTCKKFGFKPQTSGYSECRLKLEIASRQAIQQQAQYEIEKRQYDEQVAALKKEKERQRSLKQLELGLRMMGGQTIQDAAMATAGMQPLPKPPGPVNQTIIMPGGKMVNCTTTGTVTNCF